MEKRLNPHLVASPRSAIREFARLAAETPGCISLTLGEPDFPTPPAVSLAAKESLDRGETHYIPNNGAAALLSDIAAFEQKTHGHSYAPDEIIVTVGSTEALFCALFGILNPGDEVIVPTPAFGLYESIVKLCRGVYVPLDTRETGFQITAEQLRRAVTPRTKALILTSPNNPTGCVYTHETLEAIHSVVRDAPLFILCDEVYRDLTYTDRFESFSRYQDLRQQLIVAQSFSKPYAMTGWRVGYLMADRPVKAQPDKVPQYDVVSVPTFVQHACVKALDTDVRPMRETCRRRRDYVCARLDAMGLSYFRPEGAFYVFPSIAAYGMDSTVFCTRMVKEGKLACTPGVCFGAEGFLRISYCYGDDVLREGMDRLERFLHTLQTP